MTNLFYDYRTFFRAVACNQHSLEKLTATHSAFSVSVINEWWLLIWTVLLDIISIFSNQDRLKRIKDLVYKVDMQSYSYESREILIAYVQYNF